MKSFADETGETLVELMLTIVIMAIGVTSVVAALSMTIVGSDTHQAMSKGEVVVRDFGEAIKTTAIQASTYAGCPTATQLDPTPGTTSVDSSLAGAGWNARIDSVEWWVKNPEPDGTFVATSPCTSLQPYKTEYEACLQDVGGLKALIPSCDHGYQRVTFTVWNSRTDYGDTDITARVLTRRNNEVAP
jgi:type II secretory pathway pseudopilin PulG